MYSCRRSVQPVLTWKDGDPPLAATLYTSPLAVA